MFFAVLIVELLFLIRAGLVSEALLFLMCAFTLKSFTHTVMQTGTKASQPRVSSLKDNYPSSSSRRKDEERKK